MYGTDFRNYNLYSQAAKYSMMRSDPEYREQRFNDVAHDILNSESPPVHLQNDSIKDRLFYNSPYPNNVNQNNYLIPNDRQHISDAGRMSTSLSDNTNFNNYLNSNANLQELNSSRPRKIFNVPHSVTLDVSSMKILIFILCCIILALIIHNRMLNKIIYKQFKTYGGRSYDRDL